MRVLFTSTPGWGHVNPMLPLAKAFLHAGHNLLWATAPSAVERLTADGIHAAPAGPEGDQGSEAIATVDEPVHFRFPRSFAVTRPAPMLRDLLPLAGDFRPDLIIREASELAAPIVAAKRGVPALTHSHGGVIPAETLKAAVAATTHLWREHGLDEPDPYGGAYDHLYLDAWPPALHWPDSGEITTSQPLRPIDAAPRERQRPADEPPLVYVSLGTVVDATSAVLARVLDAIRTLDIEVIATVGPGRDPRALGPQPPNVRVEQFVPQADLMPRAAAVISHGGTGTLLSALAHGVPHLALPQESDQFANAHAAEHAGAGLTLTQPSATTANIRAATHRLLTDRALRRGATAVQEEIAAMPSPHAVATTLAVRYAAAAT